MRATIIYVERLKTGPGYNNKKIGIEMEVANGERAKDVLVAAEGFLSAAFDEADARDKLMQDLDNLNQSFGSDDLPF